MKKKTTKRGRHDQRDNNKRYTLSDLGGTASLLCMGFQLRDIDKTDPKRVLFIFDLCTELEETVNAYFANTLKVPARSLVDNMKMLKNRIYDNQ